MSERPTLSVVTPSYRNSQWLRLCVASVGDQGVPLEHIVQDAGSDDGTLDWLLTDSRIKAFVEEDEGMYDAVNRGWRRASGEILAYLNCDEQYLEGALAKVCTFFQDHPDVDMAFGDVVVVNAAGEYLCHRKVQAPALAHTWVCHLSTLSCATFFRRRILESGRFWFDPSYRCGGDGEWMVRLLRAGVRMAPMRQFTSVFAVTGTNLSRTPRAQEEWRRLRATAPGWMRVLAPLWIAAHRMRRLVDGSYFQKAFQFSLYTTDNLNQRVIREVARPTCRPHY